MILRGILDKALAGNFVCLRGYATLAELNQISKADESYQRDLITTHRERMVRFLNDDKHLFFPEVILGASLRGEQDPQDVADFYEQLNSPTKSSHSFAHFSIRYSVTAGKNKTEAREQNYFRKANAGKLTPAFAAANDNRRKHPSGLGNLMVA